MLAVVLAQAELVKPSTWEQFGPFAIVFVVMSLLGGGIIGWLLKDRAQTKKEHAEQLAKVEAQRDALFAQVVDTQGRTSGLLERVGPTIETNTETLARVLEHLRGS